MVPLLDKRIIHHSAGCCRVWLEAGNRSFEYSQINCSVWSLSVWVYKDNILLCLSGRRESETYFARERSVEARLPVLNFRMQSAILKSFKLYFFFFFVKWVEVKIPFQTWWSGILKHKKRIESQKKVWTCVNLCRGHEIGLSWLVLSLMFQSEDILSTD